MWRAAQHSPWYASLTFLSEQAARIAETGKPAYIYHLGDWDPSGVNTAVTIESTLCDLTPGSGILFERAAVNPEQIVHWNLPSRPTKPSDSRSKNWRGGASVELDAIAPDDLLGLVRNCISQHISQVELAELQARQRQHREAIQAFADQCKDTP